MILEAVQVLVSLLADLALVRLLLLHAHCPRIWSLGVGVDNGECTISILVESLIIVPVLWLGQKTKI